MESNNTVKFLLQGGLGNQLFILSAAKFFAKATGQSVVFETGHLLYGKPARENQIQYFSEFSFQNSPRIVILLQRVIIRAIKSFKLVEKWSKYHVSKNTGFDEFLLQALNKRLYVGYFQTWKYPSSENMKEILSTNNSHLENRIFKELKNEIESLNPIIVHIRKSDYKILNNSYGLLNSNYFNKNIDKMQQLFGKNIPIWIFTDGEESEIYSVRHDKIFDKNFELNNIQLLTLMSFAKRFIISNSSFSWWAAFLSDDQSYVIAPDPWYRNLELPTDLLPTNWIKSQAEWSEYE